MSEAPKPYSAELRAVRDQFNEIAKNAMETTKKLDTLIWKAEAAELRAKHDKVLDQFVDRRHELLAGHDVTFYIAKTAGMGEGYNSPVGAVLNTAQNIAFAVDSAHGANFAAATYDTGTKWLRLTDSDKLDKARDKTTNETHDLQPIAKEILVGNTPDKATERQKHYVIISDGKATDNIDVTAQMLTAAMALNPRITVDFINVGEKAGEGNIKDLAAKLGAPVYNVAKHEDVHGAMMAVLTKRFAKVEAPKVEAPKVEATAAPAEAPVAVAAAVEPPKQPKP
jgi:hypothetical protein